MERQQTIESDGQLAQNSRRILKVKIVAETLTIAALVISLALAAWSKGRADAIKDFRTHLGDKGDELGRVGHPYRDYWHFLDQIRTLATALAGASYALESAFGSWFLAVLIVVVLVPVFKRLIFNLEYYADPEELYRREMILKISTGSKRLDKWLGYHN